MPQAAPRLTKAVIPVAGWGTRFLPITKSVPKEMLPLLTRPMIAWMVDECVQAGIEEIVLVTRPGKRIEHYFQPDATLEKTLRDSGQTQRLQELQRILPSNVKLTVVEQKEQKGLGHALLQAESVIPVHEHFAVLLPDEVFFHPKRLPTKQLLEVYAGRSVPIVGLLAVPRPQTVHYGVASLEHEPRKGIPALIRNFVEKPKPEAAPSTWALPGRYILPGIIFNILRTQNPGVGKEVQLTDALTELCTRGSVLGVPLEGLRFDTGRWDGFLKANMFAHLFLHEGTGKEDLMSDIASWRSQWRAL